jgi:hypothetical protein
MFGYRTRTSVREIRSGTWTCPKPAQSFRKENLNPPGSWKSLPERALYRIRLQSHNSIECTWLLIWVGCMNHSEDEGNCRLLRHSGPFGLLRNVYLHAKPRPLFHYVTLKEITTGLIDNLCHEQANVRPSVRWDVTQGYENRLAVRVPTNIAAYYFLVLLRSLSSIDSLLLSSVTAYSFRNELSEEWSS